MRVGSAPRKVRQVYCDDADYAEKVPREGLAAASAEGAEEKRTGCSAACAFARGAREKHRSLDVPLS